MARIDGLNPGWRLLKAKADANVRRAVLQAEVERLNASGEVPASFSSFSVAPCREDMRVANAYGQIRATLPVATALELRCSIRLRPKPYTSNADNELSWARGRASAMEFARRFDASRLKPLADRVASIVQEALASAKDLDTPTRVVAFGATPHLGSERTTVTVDLATIGHDLRSGTSRASSVDLDELKSALDEHVASHIQLEAIRRPASSAGSEGWVDPTAMRILELSGVSLKEVIHRLEHSPLVEMSASVGGRPRSRVSIGWAYGVLNGVVGVTNDEVFFGRGHLNLKSRSLPETLADILPGRPLGSLIAHPLIPTEPVIVAVRQRDGSVLVDVEETLEPITPSLLESPGSITTEPGGSPTPKQDGRAKH